MWVRGASGAVTEKITGVPADAASWTDADVRRLLEQMLSAIDRAKNPGTAASPVVALRGFSWIVSPETGGVLVHLELQTGTASAGPFAIDGGRLTEMISRVVAGPKESSLVH